MVRVEEAVHAAQTIDQVMRGEQRWNATVVAERLLSKGYVIRRINDKTDEKDASDVMWDDWGGLEKP